MRLPTANWSGNNIIYSHKSGCRHLFLRMPGSRRIKGSLHTWSILMCGVCLFVLLFLFLQLPEHNQLHPAVPLASLGSSIIVGGPGVGISRILKGAGI